MIIGNQIKGELGKDKTLVREILGVTYTIPHPTTEVINPFVKITWGRGGLGKLQDTCITCHMICSPWINNPSRIRTRKAHNGITCLNDSGGGLGRDDYY